ncbi:MAG: hypothetical protein AB7K09_04780 [Planctomycetota bacterium]
MAEASLTAFLYKLIDYAGLFPPAKLDLDPALRNYAAYRTSSESWMLGRFIIPSKRLAELAPFHDELFTQGEPWEFSILGRGGDTTDAFLAGLDADLAAIADFRARHGERVTAEVLEVKLPADVTSAADAASVTRVLDSIAERIDASGPPSLTPFLELPLAGNTTWRRDLQTLVPALAAHEKQCVGRPRYRPAGLKLRCGGVEAAAFPTPDQIAAAIGIARGAGVKLKCTAGLHHPVRHHNDSVQTKMHGFLNVFGAGILAAAGNVPESTLLEIISDETAADFQFDDAGFGWRGQLRVPASAVEAGRTFITSYGSCSFDEPRDDLRALELL